MLPEENQICATLNNVCQYSTCGNVTGSRVKGNNGVASRSPPHPARGGKFSKNVLSTHPTRIRPAELPALLMVFSLRRLSPIRRVLPRLGLFLAIVPLAAHEVPSHGNNQVVSHGEQSGDFPSFGSMWLDGGGHRPYRSDRAARARSER